MSILELYTLDLDTQDPGAGAITVVNAQTMHATLNKQIGVLVQLDRTDSTDATSEIIFTFVVTIGGFQRTFKQVSEATAKFFYENEHFVEAGETVTITVESNDSDNDDVDFETYIYDLTSMVGTDGANTTVPDVAGTAAGLHTTTNTAISTAEGNIRGSDSDDLKDISDEVAAIPPAPNAATVATAVWDEEIDEGTVGATPTDARTKLQAIWNRLFTKRSVEKTGAGTATEKSYETDDSTEMEAWSLASDETTTTRTR